MSDRITDSLNRPWVLGPVIGRGTWGRSRTIRDDSGREAVLKEPLTAADFPVDAPLSAPLLSACTTAATEQAALLASGSAPFLPRLEATVELGQGRIGLILPRYATLQRKFEAGLPLSEALKIAQRTASALADADRTHGNLRPSNVLFGERGELFLSDLATPAFAAHHARLIAEAGVAPWLPPEHTTTKPASVWDTWALCQVVWSATLAAPTDAPARGAAPPRSTLVAQGDPDKLAIAQLKDRAISRLGTEGSNPRFRARVSDRLGALLARGLAADTEPSPPYRFVLARDLGDRLLEVLALVRPRVVDVGRILLPANASEGVFKGGVACVFTVTVGCTPGITDADDLVCGLQLVDLDHQDSGRLPIDDARLDVQIRPLGRLRFTVALPEVKPGRYRLRVAFAIKDSGDEPVVSIGEFEVRPPPGYVPPREEPTPKATTLVFPDSPSREEREGREARPSVTEAVPRSFSSAGRDEPLTDPGSDEGSDPGGELVPGPFPRPIAPPDDDSDEVPTPVVAAPAPAPTPAPNVIRPAAFAHRSPVATPATRAAPAPAGLHALPDPIYDDGEALDTEELLEDTDFPDTGGPQSGFPAAAVPPSAPGHGALPGTGEEADDLPPAAEEDLGEFGGSSRGLPAPVERLIAALRGDSYLAGGLAVAACLALLLCVSLILKAC